MDLPIAFAIPHSAVHDILPGLKTTEIERGTCWHIHLVQNEKKDFEILLPKRGNNLTAAKFEWRETSSQARDGGAFKTPGRL
jgi:hypothetical protein